MIKILKILLAILSICLGIIGFLLPLIPGWPFIILAILLIKPEQGKKFKEWLKKRRKKDHS